jgi:hypothetical protein
VNPTGEAYLREGQGAVAKARLQVGLGEAGGAESLARGALAQLSAAMNWLEDTPEFEVAHFRLDEAGRWIRETFGCWLNRQGTEYSRTCPADLAHSRLGFSPGMKNVIRECTVCGQEPRLCRHITGRAYPAARRVVGGRCNLCDRETCSHHDGEMGTAVCGHYIVSCEIVELSIVTRPAQPMARIEKVSMSTKEIAEHVGAGWHPGMDVSCDRCLAVCYGVIEHEPDPGGALT